jgi:hypothetical protein
MGFLSWEKFRCNSSCNLDCARDPRNCISERLYREQADALVQGGFAAAGYSRVNVDEDASSSRASEARATSWLSINYTSRYDSYQEVHVLTAVFEIMLCAGAQPTGTDPWYFL